MTNTASRCSLVFGIALIGGVAVLAGCPSPPPPVTATRTQQTRLP
jgi:hypothetical protein